MIFFLINRFRRKKLRARESRQTAEDQRSIVGSIGYIAGNMGYMEGNLSSMDYTYGGAATHYPLWKPPSGYFPRGEAPPPYDEAVAISQAEALSAAAAAAQAAATQRATFGTNTVELQNADLNRRAQVNQQIQHHAQPQTAHTQINHQPTQGVPTALQTHVLAPQSQQSNQTHQITQSTTNLINININSGGNITTIATGENHQPPYSLQDENGSSTGLLQQQSSHLGTQQMQMQQQQQQQHMIASTTNSTNGQGGGRVHLAQSNSICVQTMTPINQQPQQTQQQQLPQQQITTTQNVMQPVQLMTAAAATNTNSFSRQSQNLVMNNTSECGYKNCHLSVNNSTNTVSRRLQRTNEPLQQYVVDVEVNVGNGNHRGYNSLPICNNNISPADVEVVASPTQFSNNTPSIASAISTPAIDEISTNSSNQINDATSTTTISENCTQFNNTGHNTLPLQHSQHNKSSNLGGALKSSSSSSSSSSKRYHRTMPRYYATADPLSSRDVVTSNTLNTANTSKSSKTEAKLNSNNITNSNNSSANSSLISTKKPICQCPVQHVPMSYMGSTQLTNAQNVSNNAFFTVLSNKLSSSASSSPTISQQPQQQHSQRLQTNSNSNSLNYQQRPKSSQSLNHTTRDADNVIANSNVKRSLNAHCNYEPKIATISTGELHNLTANAQQQQPQQQQPQTQQHQQQQHHHHSHGHAHHHGHHSSLLPPPQHHDDSSPIVLGRVTKRSSSSSSSGDRLRSASSGSTRNSAESVGITSPAAAAYLNSKVDAYLNFAHGTNHHLKVNDLINPALPPKLHKSLTNLKASTITTSAATSSTSTSAMTTNTNNYRKNHNNSINATAIINNSKNNSNATSTNCNNFPSSSSTVNAPIASNTTSVQTIYTLSKPHHSLLSSSSSSPSSAITNAITNSNTTTTTIIGLSPSSHTRKSDHDHIMKITQQQPPSLTLPLSSITSTITSFTSSNSKINSSTFYPLQNNVTYTLPKNVGGGKMSLNSTINSVVSKVPSVINLPSTTVTNSNSNSNGNNNSGGVGDGGGGGGGVCGGRIVGDNLTNHTNLQHHKVTDTAAVSKSTTLPKILRTKRELHNTIVNNSSNLNFTAGNNHILAPPTSNTTTSSSNNSFPFTTKLSTNYAVSQCSMPAYPKQHITLSSAANGDAAAATAAATTSSFSTQQQNQFKYSHHTTTTSSITKTTATTTATVTTTSQSQPTNINMQTQTITSTLSANYCPEDSHLNPHHIIAINTINNTITTNTTTTTNTTQHSSNNSKQLPVCTTSKNCLNPKEHFLPNDTSLDDDYLSECENCKIAQSSKYYLDVETLASGPQETMTLQRKSMEECKDEPETGYYRISHTLPTNSKKNAPVKSNKREQWFSTIPAASSSSEEDVNE